MDEVRRDGRCYNCGMKGHLARDCRTRSKGKGKGKDAGKGYGKGKGNVVKGAGKKGLGKSRRFKGGRAGEHTDLGYQGQCLSCGKTGHRSSECRWGVDHVDDDDLDSHSSSSRRSGEQPESEKDSDVGGVWIVANVEDLEDEEVMDEGNEFCEEVPIQILDTNSCRPA